MTVNAYYDKPTIYTTLKFPIIAYPTYKIIKAIYRHTTIGTCSPL